MKYLKLYEEFNKDVKYTINWEGPTDELINQEMHELLNNCEFFFIEENFDKVFNKIPSFYFYIVKKYLGKETTDKEEIKKLVVGKNTDLIGMGPDMGGDNGFKKNPPEEIRKEAFNLIKSGKLIDWNEVSQTGNMGDFTQIYPLKGRKGTLGSLKINPGIEGILEFKKRLEEGDLSKVPEKGDLINYLKTYDNLVDNKNISLPAPFIIELKNNEGKPYHLIGGHKRSTIALQLGIPVKAWLIKF